jgi:hypothetical protein
LTIRDPVSPPLVTRTVAPMPSRFGLVPTSRVVPAEGDGAITVVPFVAVKVDGSYPL